MTPIDALRVRPAAVAGAFYPAGPVDLLDAIQRAFAGAVVPGADAPVPKALVVPHAGYPYSGPVAASAYLRLVPARASIRRVVLVGPSHRVPVRGVAVSSADAFATPLGLVRVDVAARDAAL
ncbi:MAG TPA: AmmeMemoRadiSam system protein B, partial [Acidimicrobiales bacterium]|nr:AmmeMemoRadiSam system protein B [Acidimicrobiales bacterium]